MKNVILKDINIKRKTSPDLNKQPKLFSLLVFTNNYCRRQKYIKVKIWKVPSTTF